MCQQNFKRSLQPGFCEFRTRREEETPPIGRSKREKAQQKKRGWTKDTERGLDSGRHLNLDHEMKDQYTKVNFFNLNISLCVRRFE